MKFLDAVFSKRLLEVSRSFIGASSELHRSILGPSSDHPRRSLGGDSEHGENMVRGASKKKCKYKFNILFVCFNLFLLFFV